MNQETKSLQEVHGQIDTTKANTFWKKILAFFGPAYLVSVGYMDPGNWATDIAGGSKYGYALLWVLVMSNIMALVLQSFAARLGIVAGKDLAQASRQMYSKPVNFALYSLAEIAIAACDLAEVLGMAIGLNLLFGLPLVWGVAFSVFDTIILLYLQKLGMKKMEVCIISLVVIIGLSFFWEIFLAKPDFGQVVQGLKPCIPDNEALYILIGIIGATVMPHNLYLHSALVQTRKIGNTEKDIKRALRFSVADSAIALNIALLVNASILVLAGTVFYQNGYHSIADITDAYKLLQPLVGTKVAPILFAIALIASGQSSTITGTLAGQIIMEGYLHLRIPIWLRRLITRMLAVVPALIVILIAGDGAAGSLLILSQVILSLQLGFAIIPLLHYVSQESKMGKFKIGLFAKITGWLIAVLILSFNVYLLQGIISDWMRTSISAQNWGWLIVVIALGLAGLLLYITIAPITKGRNILKAGTVHGTQHILPQLKIHHFSDIAITLDFSSSDLPALEYAISQGGIASKYYLLHVAETPGSLISGANTSDYESHQDLKILQNYCADLLEQGYNAVPLLGFGQRITAIKDLVESCPAQLLVMAAHGHSGVQDIIMGETIDEVRHQIKIPLLVVNV